MTKPTMMETHHRSNPFSAYPQLASERLSGVFHSFVRYVEPKPTPSPWGFYQENTLQNLGDTWQSARQGYHTEQQTQPLKRLRNWGIALFFGTALTIFHKEQLALQILAMLTFPMVSTVKNLSKMGDAYEIVQEGNPQIGKARFKEAMNDLGQDIYTFMRPLLYAGSLAILLAIPKALKPSSQFRMNPAITQPLAKVTHFFRHATLNNNLHWLLHQRLKLHNDMRPLKALGRVEQFLEETVRHALVNRGLQPVYQLLRQAQSKATQFTLRKLGFGE